MPTATIALVPISLFVPDGTRAGLTAISIEGEDSPEALITALVTAGALPNVDYGKSITCTVAEDELVYEDLTYVGKFVHLDLSDAFAEAVKMVDAAEEKLILQSLVDTFVAHYQADALVLSIAGIDLETVNKRYDRPIAFDELVKTRVFESPTS